LKFCASKVISAANNNCYLSSGANYLSNLLGNAMDNIWIYANALASAKDFTR
jgi:hypothetical protein